jgi:hypothetical protein
LARAASAQIGNQGNSIIEGRERDERGRRGKGGPQETQGRDARDRRSATTRSETVALMQ